MTKAISDVFSLPAPSASGGAGARHTFDDSDELDILILTADGDIDLPGLSWINLLDLDTNSLMSWWNSGQIVQDDVIACLRIHQRLGRSGGYNRYGHSDAVNWAADTVFPQGAASGARFNVDDIELVRLMAFWACGDIAESDVIAHVHARLPDRFEADGRRLMTQEERDAEFEKGWDLAHADD